MTSSLLDSGTYVTKGRAVAGTPDCKVVRLAHPISALAHLRARENHARRRGPSPHSPGRLCESLGSPDSALACRKQG